MANESGQKGDIDIDGLLESLEATAAKAKGLSEEISTEPTLEEGSGEKLIEEVAASLATMRESSHLPDKGADQFKASIKKRLDQDFS